MKYSFVIPTHNSQRLLINTLEALNHQTGYGSADYEVLVVDDGSTDGTGEAIRGINRNYPLRYFYLERSAESCRARTRNTGWRNARGEIIVFIDSDILVRNDYLAELERCFAFRENLVVIGNRLMLESTVTREELVSGTVFEQNRFAPERLMLLESRYFLYETASYNFNAIMCPWMQVYSCNLAVPRMWLAKVGGFDENFKNWGMEDLELGYALYREDLQIVINPKLEVLHQNHGDRNDLVIRPENMAGYEQNIDYFMKKHPQALKMRRKHALQFLKGELPKNKFQFELGYTFLEFGFKNRADLERVKTVIAKVMARRNTILAVYDYVEDTGLDLWIQLLGDAGRMIHYYPMSKRMDREAAARFLKAEQERERMQA